MIQIPKFASLLSRLASKGQARYALKGVQVDANGTEYKLIATDGHVLGVLRGSVIPPGMELCTLVPAKAWDQAFKLCGKDSHVELHPDRFIIPGEASAVVAFTPLDGRFPEWLRVMPEQMPLFRMKVNPAILVRLLQVADAVSRTHDDQANTVELFFYAPTTPIGVVAVGQDVIFDGLCMPLS